MSESNYIHFNKAALDAQARRVAELEKLMTENNQPPTRNGRKSIK